MAPAAPRHAHTHGWRGAPVSVMARCRCCIAIVTLLVSSWSAADSEERRCAGDVVASGEPRRPPRVRRTTSRLRATDPPQDHPHKISCPMATRIISKPNVHARGDVIIPLCSGFNSPWNNYITVSLPNLAPSRGPRSVLSLVDTGDSDLMILPWWGNTTEADLQGANGEFRVTPPFELVCKRPMPDSFGIQSLLIRGPITLGSDLTFVSEFYQNIATQGPDNVGNLAPGNAYTHGYGVGKSPIWWSGFAFAELDLRLNRRSTMRFSNRSAVQEGYHMMATDNRTSAMAVLATAIDVGALKGDKESFRQEFKGKGIEAILDTGGQATALKADGAFIETPGLSSTNCTDCPTDQGPDAKFFNTTFRIELDSNESSLDNFTIVGSPLSSVFADGGSESPNLWVGKSLPDVFADFGTGAVNVGGPAFEKATMLIDIRRPRVGLKVV